MTQRRQNARPLESRGPAGLGQFATRLARGAGIIQITAQMRVLVAIEPVDGRKGIDSLARLCQESSPKIPDVCSCFGAAAGPPSASSPMVAGDTG